MSEDEEVTSGIYECAEALHYYIGGDQIKIEITNGDYSEVLNFPDCKATLIVDATIQKKKEVSDG